MKRVFIGDSFILMLSVLLLADENGWMFYFLTAALVHEAGHFLVILLCGGRVQSIHLSAVGAVMKYHASHSPLKRCLIALGGPAMSFAAAWAAGKMELYVFAGASFLLGAFNMLPIVPLDGGTLTHWALSPFGRVGQTAARWLSYTGTVGVLLVGFLFFRQKGGAGLLFVGIILSFYQKNLQIKRKRDTI